MQESMSVKTWEEFCKFPQAVVTWGTCGLYNMPPLFSKTWSLLVCLTSTRRMQACALDAVCWGPGEFQVRSLHGCASVCCTLEPAVLCWQHLHCRWLRERPAVQALSSSKLFVPLLYYILLLACKVGRSGVCCDNSVDVAYELLTYRSGAHICVI